MSSMKRVIACLVAMGLFGCALHPTPENAMDKSEWITELENGGEVTIHDGAMEINVPAGCTVWYRKLLQGATTIEYDITPISQGGPNDRVSDMNCFWMARDARSMNDLFATVRSGKFADYNQLKCYYVGYGGNANTTTRFRRYIGSATTRPLLPEHDLTDKQFLLIPNHTYHIKLVAQGSTIQYWRDGEMLFDFSDPEPYTSGWFAFRTVTSHLKITNFRVRCHDHD